MIGPDRVRVHGEIWSATGASQLSVGQRVRVAAVDGLTLRVEPERNQAATSPPADGIPWRRVMQRPLLAAGLAGLACVFIAAASLAATGTGGHGHDRLTGTKGGDELDGGGGPDLLIGGRGNDVLVGGHGRDTLRGGPGRDGYNVRDGEELPAPGADRISARDGVPDEINCGGGVDTAVVDAAEDGVYNCERVYGP